MLKYQNYQHYKLPITMNPLEYGKLINQYGNEFIIQMVNSNIFVIIQHKEYNHVKFYRQGELMFEYNDHIIDETTFIRNLDNIKFTYKNNILVLTTTEKSISTLKSNNSIRVQHIQNSIIPNWNPRRSFSTSANRILNWIDYNVNIKNKVFTKDLLNTNLNKFWTEIVDQKVGDNQHIWLLFRLRWANGDFVTIGKLQRLNKEDKLYLLNFILDEIEDKSEYYKTTNMIAMVFSYNIKNGRAKEKLILENQNLQYQDYFHHKLPITMNPLEYGKIIDHTGNKFIVQISKTNLAIIIQEEPINKVKFYKSGEFKQEYFDKKINDSTFIRTIGNKQFTFKDSELILFTSDKSVKFISPLKDQENLDSKFITMDIETFIKKDVHEAYAISFYDGENTNSYYLTNYKDSESMIIDCIKELMIKKYDNWKIYIHNLSNFDANFLLKILVNLGDVKPIIHNNKIISLTFKLNGYVVIFKDSQQMLIRSLKDLGEAFGVDIQKSIFPYNFVREDRLNYIGWVPDFKYFNKISKIEYQNYLNNFKDKTWNLEAETIKYCEIDCISLHQIIFKFNNLIAENFKINIHKYPTLSSLAFAIFRTHFLNENTIPQLSGQIAKDIRLSYTGGAVDMYLPFNEINTKIFCYDVNALYPFTMEDKAMPVGKPIFFKGDIRSIDPNAFGFFYCKIETPDDLMHPIIQTHIQTDAGVRTIAPLGTWFDMIFSEEMDNAVKLGYKFEILWGYKFESKIVFKEYVDVLYALRKQYPKSHPLNFIAKLLMNSLYGRFGMIDNFPNIKIFKDKKTFLNFMKDLSIDILDTTELGNKLLIQYKSENDIQQTMLYGNLETHNTNVAIASAITAYARIHMSQFKNNPDYILYYSDTDSAYISKPLPENMVDSKTLGKMKLENILNKGIFLAPKVYYLKTIDGKIIYKVKGLSHDITLTLEDFENLLIKESWIKKIQTKWRKNLSDANISVIDEIYTLQVTSNKRKLIYENNKLIKTEPYIINANKEVLNK